MKKYNFVYVTTNVINDKKYIGSHATDSLEDGYIGSGKIFLNALKKYKKENFERKILQKCETIFQARELEKEFITRFNTLVPDGYNLSPTGGCSHQGGELAESHKKNIGDSLRGRTRPKEVGEKIRKKRIKNDSYHLSEESRNLIRISLTGRKDSEETIKNKRNADRSKWNMSKEGRKNISISTSKRLKGKPITKEHKENIINNSSKYWTGKNLSLEHKQKLSNSHKGIVQKRKVCEHCKKEIAVNIYARFHGEKCKSKI